MGCNAYSEEKTCWRNHPIKHIDIGWFKLLTEASKDIWEGKVSLEAEISLDVKIATKKFTILVIRSKHIRY